MKPLKHTAFAFGLMAWLSACATADDARTLSEHSQSAAAVEPQLSAASFAETRERVKNAIDARELTIFAIVDHAAGARSASLALPENTVFVFGNPKAGTPLMAANPVLGLELPLKVSVYENAGQIYVVSSDIRAIAARAGVSEPAAIIDRIERVLADIVKDATAN